MFDLIAKDFDAVMPNILAYAEEAMTTENKPVNFTEKDIAKAKRLFVNLNTAVESLRIYYKVLHSFNKELFQPIDEFPAQTIKSYIEEALDNHYCEEEFVRVKCPVDFVCHINPFFIASMLFRLLTLCFL